MKKIILLFSIFLTSVSYAQGPCQGNGIQISLSENGICNYDPYILVFQDEFDSDELDLNKWNPMYGVVRDEDHSGEKQWYSPNNIVIENGIMKLEARAESLANQCYSIWTGSQMETFCENFDYTSAEIDTKYKFEHGKFEIRCKLPKGKGFFPAFWTFGGAKWNEIDVFEFNNPTNIFQNYEPDKLSKVHHMNTHYDFDGDGFSENCSVKYTGPDFSEDFHTFTLIWTPHRIVWYVDGDFKHLTTLFYTIQGQVVDCNGIEAYHQYLLNKAFPREAMNIIANLAIQSGGNSPDGDTPFPSALEIDYIRYYKQIDNCNSNINIETIEDLNLQNGVYNVIVGNVVNFSDNVVFDGSDQLTIIASENIIIDENSILEGNIETIIDPFFCSSQLIQQEPETGAIEDRYVKLNSDTLHKVTISPNPFENELSIDVEEKMSPSNVLVFDLIGNLVFTFNVENPDFIQFNIPNLHSGAYILYIFDQKGEVITTRKIFKS